MRVDSVSVNYSLSKSNLRKAKQVSRVQPSIIEQTPKADTVAFKGVGGGTGGLLGTITGIGLGLLTGGAAPLFAAIIGCAAGSIAGSELESKNPTSDDDYDDIDPTYPNRHDY